MKNAEIIFQEMLEKNGKEDFKTKKQIAYEIQFKLWMTINYGINK